MSNGLVVASSWPPYVLVLFCCSYASCGLLYLVYLAAAVTAPSHTSALRAPSGADLVLGSTLVPCGVGRDHVIVVVYRTFVDEI